MDLPSAPRSQVSAPWTRLALPLLLIAGLASAQHPRGGAGEPAAPGVVQEGHEVAEDVRGCPPRCLCFRTTVRCMFLQLERVPDSLPEQTTVLDLRFNRIRVIEPGKFARLRDLSTLLLNNNQLGTLKSGVFSGLSQLRYLYIYKNELSEIDSDVFQDLTQLEQLYLHFNELETLTLGTFDGLTALERLYAPFLHNNKLQRLPKGLLSDLPALRRLRLDSNMLVCDCGLLWLSELLQEGHIQAALSCERPAALAGRSLAALADVIHCRMPELTTQPRDTEVSLGNTAVFNCGAEGDPRPEIVWYRNSERLEMRSLRNEDSHRLSVLDDGSLRIEGARISDGGTYECRAENELGEARSHPAHLRYLGGDEGRRGGISHPTQRGLFGVPQLTIDPEEQTRGEGDSATLDCQFTGSPRPPRLVWFKNDEPVPPSDPRVRVESSSGGGSRLVLTDLRHSDRGVFRCVASNAPATTYALARLEVHVAPQFLQRPKDQRVVEGHSAFFTCDVTGEPPLPTISWSKDGRPLVDGDQVSFNPSATTLTIGLVRASDAGLYECTATSAGGKRTASARLQVVTRTLPIVVRGPSDVRTQSGSRVQFDCDITGEPQPIIRWQRDSIPVPLTTSEKYLVTRQGSLIIQVVVHSDEGVYQCVAENVAGRASASATLTVWDTRFDTLTSRHINDTVESAARRVATAIDNTNRDLRDLRSAAHHRTAADLMRIVRSVPASAQSVSRAAEVFEQSLELLFDEVRAGASYSLNHTDPLSYEDLLTPTQLAMVSSLSGCLEHRPIATCDDMCFHSRYRTFDGACNNLRKPMLGASLSSLLRLRPSRYENNFNLPIGWDPDRLYNGVRLPSARAVSVRLISTPRVTADDLYTHMLMQWGQFVDHDLDFVPTAVSHARFSDGRFCNETCHSRSAPCFPIPVEESDPRVRQHRCIGFVRSSAMCGSGMTSVFFERVIQREQLNLLTAYMDASQVYGSSDDDARNLRDFSSNRGLLRGGTLARTGKQLLPPNQGEFNDCQVDPNTAHVPCFQAGDHRANEQLGLLAMHTIWFREHNRLATELLRDNPHWDGDSVYHEARKIVGAVMQRITFEHWLPKILGPAGMERLGPYEGYDPTIDTRVSNEFATAAFRFGHTLINPVLSRLNASFQPIPEGNLLLHRAFFAPFRLTEEGGVDPLLRGLFGVAAKRPRPGEFLNVELTEHLFTKAHDVAQDLGSLNIQRGRDHGLQSYNAYRELCGLQRAHTFDDFRREIRSADVRRKLQDLYRHPDNVELFAGGIAEDTMDGARIGPTFICIIADQMRRIRAGDRLWYENPGVFTSAQLTELRQASLSRVICDNADDITEIQRDAFLLAPYPSGLLHCEREDIPRVNLKVWAQCCQDCSRLGDFRSISSHFRGRRSVDQTYEGDRGQVNATVNQSTGQDENKAKRSGDQSSGKGNKITEAKQELSEHESDWQRDEDASSHSRQEMVDHMTEMSQKVMDVVDVRIEGMEDVMNDLQAAVQRLSKKMKKFEKSGGRGEEPSVSSCLDDKGRTKVNGDTWREGDCKTCVCIWGQLECKTETCPTPSCSTSRRAPGACCPTCP